MDENSLDELIYETEKTYNKCIDTIINLKQGKLDSVKPIMEFQPELAECLYGIMEKYQRISSKERDCIDSRGDINQCEFEKVMRSYSVQKTALKKLIEIGKCIGDNFAWFFYMNSRDELRDHLSHPSNGLFTSGIGGRGEVEFIKKINSIDGLFVLYHGITSMLRVGDFSLCTRDGKVLGVGELKTQKINERLVITAYISAKKDLCIDIQNTTRENLTEAICCDKEGLNKQLNRQDEVLTHKPADKNFVLYSNIYQYDAIERAIKSEHNIAISRDNSMVVIIGYNHNSLKEELMLENETEYELSDDSKNEVQNIFISKSEYNALWITNIDCRMLGFRKPVLWWGLENDYIKDIIWGRIKVLSVFNVAHFCEAMIKEGFEVRQKQVKGGKATYEFFSDKNGGKLNIENTEYVMDLMCHDFLAFSEVVKMYVTISKEIVNGEKDGCKVEFYINQCF